MDIRIAVKLVENVLKNDFNQTILMNFDTDLTTVLYVKKVGKDVTYEIKLFGAVLL